MENKKTNTFLVHYSMTEELFEHLISRGKHVVCISYGYANEMDLIIWED